MRYDKDFKLQAPQMSDEISVKAAAEQLGLKDYTLADWRKIRKEQGENAFIGSSNRQVSMDGKRSLY